MKNQRFCIEAASCKQHSWRPNRGGQILGRPKISFHGKLRASFRSVVYLKIHDGGAKETHF